MIGSRLLVPIQTRGYFVNKKGHFVKSGLPSLGRRISLTIRLVHRRCHPRPLHREKNCKFGTPKVALRGFAIASIDFAEMGLETLFYCKSCHYAYFLFLLSKYMYLVIEKTILSSFIFYFFPQEYRPPHEFRRSPSPGNFLTSPDETFVAAYERSVSRRRRTRRQSPHRSNGGRHLFARRPSARDSAACISARRRAARRCAPRCLSAQRRFVRRLDARHRATQRCSARRRFARHSVARRRSAQRRCTRRRATQRSSDRPRCRGTQPGTDCRARLGRAPRD
jgi:hypothetical protein